MYKKGFSAHIDWVIGIGIFLVYLGLVFIIFKPGVTPVFDSETLLDIVETNFLSYNVEDNGGVWWDISKTPLFVKAVPSGSPGVDCSRQEAKSSTLMIVKLKDFENNIQKKLDSSLGNSKENELFLIPGKDDINEDSFQRGGRDENALRTERGRRNVLEVVSDDEDDDEVISGRNSEDNSVQDVPLDISSRPFSVGFTLDSNLKFLVSFGSVDNSIHYLFLHSEGEDINLNTGFPENLPEGVSNGLEADYKNGCYFENVDPLDPGYNPCTVEDGKYRECIAKYEFGTTEYVEGINIENIPEKIDYNEIKSVWKFPELKEFQIVVYDKKLEYARFPDFALPAGVNIYSRQVNSFMLSKDGKRIPVTVNFMVW